jgi:hypothetical protein
MSQEIPIISAKGSAGGNDDTFFWEELLADDNKDFTEEYLGIKADDQVRPTEDTS